MNSGIAGASSGGVLSEMIALGAMESYLIKGATVTFFRYRFARHSNFALESVYQQFNSQVSFGSDSEILLNRVGDLIYFLYIVIDLPGIVACRNGSSACGGNRIFRGVNPYPSLNAVDAAGDGDSGVDNFQSGAQEADQLYFDQYYNGVRDAYLTDQYGARNAAPAPDAFTDTSSFQQEFFQAACDNSGLATVPWVHWHQAIGQKIIERAAYVIGGHMIDQLFSDYLYMWEELSGKAGKRLREMIGKRDTRRQLIEDSKANRRLYVPLPFSFTQNSGNALPLVSLQYHGVRLHVKFEELKNLLVVSDPNVNVLKSSDFTPLQSQDLKAWVDTTYVYLDVEERNRFSTANFDQLITQVQYYTDEQRTKSIHIPIRFNHPCIEFIWALRRKVNEDQNNSFNYSGIDGRDPFSNLILKFNNQPRFSGRTAQYFRLVQPYQFHSSIPDSHVYCYSFALDPESAQPTGSVNLSRIDNAEMIIDLQEGLEQEVVQVILYARNWNILRFVEGVGGTLFSN
jgi:hypothetical protein